MIHTVAVENYRSLRRLIIPLDRLTVVTGANGSGKSNLYRSLRLLADAARNGVIAALAREGGLGSTLWAGPEQPSRSMRQGRHPVQGTTRRRPVGLRLGFACEDFGYAIDLGLPMPEPTAFTLDPEVKCEAVWAGGALRPATALVERRGPVVRIRAPDGGWRTLSDGVERFDTMLSELSDPEAAPELLALRHRIRDWRFYDQFRTDAMAPARAARIGTRTPVLDADGGDLAAALQTIREAGDVAQEAMDGAIDEAFPGSTVEIRQEAGRFELLVRQPGLLRPLRPGELSDGTLRYLLWTAALLTPRPASLLVLNEPENSLHPDLLPALAGLIVTAAGRTQVVLVSHSEILRRTLTERSHRAGISLSRIELTKELGQTRLEGQRPMDEPPWRWPAR